MTARLRDLSLRAKVLITVIGASGALLGGATYLSFRYWEREVVAAAEQQALLSARAVRAGLDPALWNQRTAEARNNLTALGGSAPIRGARVFAPDGSVLLSTDALEEGHRAAGAWIPARGSVPERGLVRLGAEKETVHAFVPLSAPGASLLHVEFSVEPLTAAMRQGARLGVGLLVGSLVALAAILFTMMEREVVAPVKRVGELLSTAGNGEDDEPGHGELERIESSVVRLIEEEREAERRARERERELREKAGFAEVGELAAEMAHEFKRPLASIRSALELIEQEYEMEGGEGDLLEAVEGQLDRVSETMRDLLSLARPVEVEREALSLHPLLDEAVLEVRGHPAAEGVVLEREYAPGDVELVGDRSRLGQAVVNVLLNAAEAIEGEGRITVRTRSGGEGRIAVEIEDTGSGIPEAEIAKVLRPFYSKKPMGTGLGLSLVARVVAAHDGSLDIRSEPGRGTVVRLELPTSARRERSQEEVA